MPDDLSQIDRRISPLVLSGLEQLRRLESLTYGVHMLEALTLVVREVSSESMCLRLHNLQLHFAIVRTSLPSLIMRDDII